MLMLLLSLALGTVAFLRWRGVFKRALSGVPFNLVLFRAAASAVAWTSGSLIFVVAAVYGRGIAVGRFQVVLLVVLGFAVLVERLSRLVLSSMVEAKVTGVKEWFFLTLRRLRSLLKRFLSLIAPTGWSEFGNPLNVMDILVEYRGIAQLYVVSFGFVPIVLAPMAVLALEGIHDPQRTALSAAIGYNGLVVISSLTAAFLCALLLAWVLSIGGVFLSRIHIGGALRVVVSFIGYGTMVGVITAALMPIAVLWIRASPGSVARVLPERLLDVPAAFGLLGAMVGILVSSTQIYGSAENLVLRRVVPVFLFVVVVGLLGFGGVAPSSLFYSVTSDVMVAPGMCVGDEFEKHLNDGAWMLRALEACGHGNWIIPDKAYFRMVACGGAIAAGFTFVSDFLRAARTTQWDDSLAA